MLAIHRLQFISNTCQSADICLFLLILNITSQILYINLNHGQLPELILLQFCCKSDTGGHPREWGDVRSLPNFLEMLALTFIFHTVTFASEPFKPPHLQCLAQIYVTVVDTHYLIPSYPLLVCRFNVFTLLVLLSAIMTYLTH